ncbi:PE-PPE domain-containing protein [Mycobacterium sp. IDR2000157661]|uniref:PE-PPE domain-containing protein n=1 Tax=Mycobacterium sp. IDR2000157661 TaxID=2867005 RepID=UPI001EEC55CC|nr:PE-PPE domain-containing protein [Mycobacterium sp. IDR2000157661]ULE31292.1 PE-PPE domain-containing protein [Mycobacterium sp. IDR2000157661]
MRVVIRSMGMACLAVLGTVVLAVAWTAATTVQLAATALIMGGSFHPLSTPPDDAAGYVNPYLNNAVLGFVNPAASAPTGTGHPGISHVADGDPWLAVITPEEFFPIFGSMPLNESVTVGLVNLSSCVRGTGCEVNRDALIDPQPPDGHPAADDEFAIFGYSQSALIAALLKRDLIANPGQTPTVASFFLLANPMRPNGGILARSPVGFTVPILGVTFYGPTPTNSCEAGACMPTVDAAAQYDALGGDAPASLTNLLAIVNAAAGYHYLHSTLQHASFNDARYQGSYGDTDYYLYPTQRLPILMPFDAFVPSPILTALDAPLRVLIEGAYRRDVNPGIATTVSLLPFHDPIRTILNLLLAIPTGIDDALAEATGNPTFRPLGTAPVTTPYGVGGPQLPAPPDEAEENEVLSLRTEPVGRTDEDGADDAAVGTGADGEVTSGDDGDASATSRGGDVTDPPERPRIRGPIQFDSDEQGDVPTTEESGTATTAEPELDQAAEEGAADAEEAADDAGESANADAA